MTTYDFRDACGIDPSKHDKSCDLLDPSLPLVIGESGWGGVGCTCDGDPYGPSARHGEEVITLTGLGWLVATEVAK